MSGYDSTTSKRRRIGTVDLDYAYVAHPTTSRTKAAEAARQQQQQQQMQVGSSMNNVGNGGQQQQGNGPIISFSALPTTALQRYLLRYGLLEPQGSLSYHHSVFPVPPLPSTLYPPLEGRTLNTKNAQQTYVPARRIAHLPQRTRAEQEEEEEGERDWIEPKTEEFAKLTAFDDPRLVVERLAKRATAHWDKRDSVKEGETLTNFMFSVRMRGESEWNKLNLFTGWKNPALTEKGRAEALEGAKNLKKAGLTHFDVAYTSVLQRANDTLDIILKEIGQEGLEIHKDQALNERDYGELTGLNKDDARKKWGDEQVHIWRRSYDVPPPGGESLELTAKRVLPYYEEHVVPAVKSGKKVLVAAHGNSLRSMIMKLENMSGEEIVNTELATGVPIVYRLDNDGKVISKEVLNHA
ncbi:uncharacterized protein JCM6883_007282 [Sporobolomyces salmoneus]|uniref:uncharacterized protein n=1 Tax=Sporobolomyces salmoneus TaxID=183962 RepID=UPI003174BA94